MMLRFSATAVDLDAATARRGAEVHALTALELALLRFLLDHPGEVVSRDTLLVEVWGYKAGLRTRAVDNTVARLRAKIEADPAKPRHLHTVRGVGYRLDLPAEPEGAGLVGRAADLEALEGALAARCVSLLGPGGVGKTTLARALLERYDGLFIDLTEIQSPRGVAALLLAALGREAGPDPLEALPLALPAAPPLLVLDNAEGVAEALRGPMPAWLDALPEGCCVLLTSRVALGLAQERRVHLGPLAPEAAQRLMQLRLPAEVHLDVRALAPLLARLDGLPLAIELAAAWLDLASPEQLAARLDAQLQVLSDRHQRHPDRHASLEAVMQLSWEQLDPDERSALAQCALFAEGFDLIAAESVLKLRKGRWALELLGRLRDKSLLVVGPAGEGGPRYRLLETVRVFAAARLEDPEAPLRHARHYAARVEAEGQALFETDAANLTAAMQRALARDPELAMAIYVRRFPWVYLHGVLEEELALTQRLARALGPTPSLSLARALWARAQLLTRLGDTRECLALCEQALASLPAGEAPGVRAQLLRNRGYYALLNGQLDRARAWLHEALAAARAAEHASAERYALHHLAELEADLGRFDLALAHVEAIEAQTPPGAPGRLAGDVARMRAHVCAGLGRWEEAERAIARAQEADPEGSFPEALTQVKRAEMCFALGRMEACVEALERAEAVLELRRDAVASAVALQLRALLLWRAGALEEAAGILAEVEAVMGRHGRWRFLERARAARAALDAERGRAGEAVAPSTALEPTEAATWAGFAALGEGGRSEAAITQGQRGPLYAQVAAALLRARADARAGRGRVLRLRPQ